MIATGVPTVARIALGEAIAQVEMDQMEVAKGAGIHYNLITACKRGRPIRRKNAYSILRVINAKRKVLEMEPLGLEDIQWTLSNYDV